MSDSSKALIPGEQRSVIFYDDEIPVVIVGEESERQVYVPVRPICDFLGVDHSAQLRRIRRDPVLSEELTPCVVVTATQGQPDQRREVQCLPLDFINGFLFGINATRVKDSVQDRLLRYQRECYKTLAEAFQEGRLTAEPSLDQLVRTGSEAAQAYQMALAVVKLARNQLLMEARLGSVEKRLELVETTLGDDERTVTQDQASQISQAVKAIAMQLSKGSGRNEYGGVYGEFYRKFGITSYKMLPARKFEVAMQFLQEWHQSLVSGAPF